MPCDPNDNTINPPPWPPPLPVPPFGLPFAPFSPPFPDMRVPEGIPEDILDLIDRFFAMLPGGKFLPNLDDALKTPLGAVASLLNEIAPYLALYNFFQALLNIILCIIDILCCLFNPWCAARAVRKLFKRCLPDFLNLFPWLALIAMIIALLLLLLALLEYIWYLIKKYIEDLLANINMLADALSFENTNASLAIVRKMAFLLCLIEELFAILIAFQAILAIIEALKSIASRSVCSRGSSRRGDDGVCCDNEFCPPFLAENPDGYVIGTQGSLIYYPQVVTTTVPSSISRYESWQFVDVDQSKTYQFNNIIEPINNFIYWPQPLEFDNTTALNRVPYSVDMILVTDPTQFGHTDTVGGSRAFQIKDIIVSKIPYIGTYDHENILQTEVASGTFALVGGKVYEEDGITPFNISGKQATLQTFIHQPIDFSSSFPDDGYVFENVSYYWKFNWEALVSYQLISIMCMPSLGDESAVLNATLDVPNITNIPLPDAKGAADCMAEAMAILRKDVSAANLAAFSAAVDGCLGTLQTNTENCYRDMFIAGANRYHSSVTLDPDLQFIGQPIIVTVIIKDGGNTVISTNIPVTVRSEISAQLRGHVTLGSISNFEYDGYTSFIAQINSEVAGTGELSVTFNEAYFAQILNRDDDDARTTVEITALPYQFIGAGFAAGIGAIGGDERQARRDESDVARDGE